MTGAVYESPLAGGITAPQYKDEMLAMIGQMGYHLIGEEFPSPILVRAGTMCLNSEGGIEQKYALTCPTGKITTGRNWSPSVVMYFFKDIE